jgi:hypothetical protein
MARNGKRIGRIEEVRADVERGECYVSEFLVGAYATFERLSAFAIARAVLDVFGSTIKESYRIPWNQLDLTDPAKPVLLCDTKELAKLKL